MFVGITEVGVAPTNCRRVAIASSASIGSSSGADIYSPLLLTVVHHPLLGKQGWG